MEGKRISICRKTSTEREKISPAKTVEMRSRAVLMMSINRHVTYAGSSSVDFLPNTTLLKRGKRKDTQHGLHLKRIRDSLGKGE
jgi:hypothetical protein